jgi:hypothetical protein
MEFEIKDCIPQCNGLYNSISPVYMMSEIHMYSKNRAKLLIALFSRALGMPLGNISVIHSPVCGVICPIREILPVNKAKTIP